MYECACICVNMGVCTYGCERTVGMTGCKYEVKFGVVMADLGRSLGESGAAPGRAAGKRKKKFFYGCECTV